VMQLRSAASFGLARTGVAAPARNRASEAAKQGAIQDFMSTFSRGAIQSLRILGWVFSMPLVFLGLVLLVLRLAGVGFIAAWPWWGVLSPFGAALLWWWWADTSGWTQRRAMDRDTARKEQRRARNLDALGIEDPKKRKR
jgi:small Trp-rich protein